MLVHSYISSNSVLLLLSATCLQLAACNEHAKKLHAHLMANYSLLVRPVANSSEWLNVKLGLKLSQLIGVDEKNQVMTTNVWLSQEWVDTHLTWNREDYGGVDHLYIPAEKIWKPDIVLYNNADGNFQITLSTKATVYYDGRVYWEPPAIYKSSCEINVAYFPFDEQTCNMKFSSWTYTLEQINLKHMYQADVAGEVDIVEAIDMSDYSPSFVWDVMSVPARRNKVKYPCCVEIYPDVTFSLTIRRKTLFYTVNLIIPCVAISFLTVLVFYLPSDSGEKITLCISILLSLTVFFLLLSELIPPTSLVIPLIGKYLLFTMILVTCSVVITVGVLNLHNRSKSTHEMPDWIKSVFLEKLPKYLLMKRPNYTGGMRQNLAKKLKSEQAARKSLSASLHKSSKMSTINGGIEMESLLSETRTAETLSEPFNRYMESTMDSTADIKDGLTMREQKALEGIKFIAEHLQDEHEEKQVAEDWKYVAMVVDRLFLWIFSIVCCLGTLSLMLMAPTLFDNRKPHPLNGGN